MLYLTTVCFNTIICECAINVSFLKIRRIVGIAHVEDLESIKDADVRSSCEKVSLLFARRLVVGMSKCRLVHSLLQVDWYNEYSLK